MSESGGHLPSTGTPCLWAAFIQHGGGIVIMW